MARTRTLFSVAIFRHFASNKSAEEPRPFRGLTWWRRKIASLSFHLSCRNRNRWSLHKSDRNDLRQRRCINRAFHVWNKWKKLNANITPNLYKIKPRSLIPQCVHTGHFHCVALKSDTSRLTNLQNEGHASQIGLRWSSCLQDYQNLDTRTGIP